jgi:hypothetical protein
LVARVWAGTEARIDLLDGLTRIGIDEISYPAEAIDALDRWISWARRGRLPQFVKLARSITRDHDAIIAAIINTLSNALIESTNTTIRLIIRRAFGFHSAHAIIALARLTLGGHPPEPPGR